MSKKKQEKSKSSKNQKVKYKLYSEIIILPNALNNLLEQKVIENPPNFPFDITRAKIFLWLIMHRNTNDWDIQSLNEYIPIPYQTLKNYSPSYYGNYLQYLEEINLVEYLGYKNFPDEKRCRLYRLSSEALTALWDSEAHFTTINLKDLKSKVRTNIRKYKIEPRLYMELPHLMKWYNNKLTVDFVAAEEFVHSNGFEADQIYRHLFKLTNFKESNFYASKNNHSDGRLHTNLSNFPKILRPFLKYDGENLVSYDLKSSQPFFLIALIEKIRVLTGSHFGSAIGNDKILEKIRGIMRLNDKKNKENNSYILQSLREVLNSSGFTEEFDKFKMMYQNDIYNELGNVLIKKEDEESYHAVDDDYNQIFNKDGEPKWLRKKEIEYKCRFSGKTKVTKVPVLFDCKRDMMKVVVLNILYGGIKKKSPEYKTFDTVFPLISQILSIFKKEDKKVLPKILQQIESECILDVVSKKLAERYPDMPMWTIHDSIITTESYANTLHLKTEIQAFVKEYCNVLPLVEEEFFCKECNNKAA